MDKEKVLSLLKDGGLDAAEDVAVAAVKAVFNLIRVLTPELSTGLGMIIPGILNIIEPPILAALDAIDGEDDPGY